MNEIKQNYQGSLLYWLTQSIRCSSPERLRHICSEVERVSRLHKEALDTMEETNTNNSFSCTKNTCCDMVRKHNSNIQQTISNLFNGV